MRGIYQFGFEKPSAIQQRAIIPIAEGRDVIAQAQSGTGKTSMIAVSMCQRVDTQMRECGHPPAQVLSSPGLLDPVNLQSSQLTPANLGDQTISSCLAGYASVVARSQVITPLGLSSVVAGHRLHKRGAQPFPESEGPLVSREHTCSLTDAALARVQGPGADPVADAGAGGADDKDHPGRGRLRQGQRAHLHRRHQPGCARRAASRREPHFFAATVSTVIPAHRLLRSRVLGAAGWRLLVSSG